MRNVAKNALCYGLEAGLQPGVLSSHRRNVRLFILMPVMNTTTQEEAEGSATMEKRCQVSKWTAGVNWFALPNLDCRKPIILPVILVRTRYLDH